MAFDSYLTRNGKHSNKLFKLKRLFLRVSPDLQRQPSKLLMRVRFPPPALQNTIFIHSL
ncbi:hypothetical protein [Planktothrix tepida]|uniref:hypothetical protein n=1 Tax=Planktothrix tepida TaxID=1678309 RepID=UPI0020B355C7|nr:hypothetical protein [Planktothrix tepida]